MLRPAGHPTALGRGPRDPAHPEFADGRHAAALHRRDDVPLDVPEIAALRPFAGAADLLADADDWPDLYDPARLAANEVPVAAVVYFDDMYVDAELSLTTAAAVGNTRAWVTNEYEHDGSAISGGKVLARLMDMAAGRI